MSQTSTLKGQCIAEFLGTGLLIFFGVGCVAALKVAGASFGQWEISVIWGLGVAMAIYLTAGVSGAHLNPAVTIALWLFACFDKRKVIPFIVSQVAGAFCAAALVYGLYYNLFFDFEQTHHIVRGSVESVDLAGTFSTYPNPHINFVQAFAVEMVITAILTGLILVLTGRWQRCTTPSFGSLADWSTDCGHWRIYGPIPEVFAINPARDFGPKALRLWRAAPLPLPAAETFLTSCAAFRPIVGAIVGAFAYRN
ncbi:MIP/aquaporin family protein [Shigella flexneri]